ncbi:chromosome segregation and condensation protein ScpA [Paenibacillus curdlanolyticus YK9]|uniref:Segregation and condensation protein A n=1 Tax=Paenibacillus curdlanolyticus YK9 TaxID=717606 RepID=E0ICE1_9BACL|nr:segregation/condensation protein A [Paenibacillus curdlanolyticus]EFM09827.1 chromosome segregation and condensation protein ScpA [Paenibacillus curdlanolyticus YK9]
MTVTYKLETFEGPLDLLLHLIDKAEIDIHEVSISEITDQYMEYLQAMQELELDVTSEFLVMAATLLSIKSKQLLPKPPVIELDEYDDWQDDGPDPQEELIARLLEYRKFKLIAADLREKELESSLVYAKEPEDLSPFMKEQLTNPVEGLHIDDLVRAFQKALRRAARRNVVATVRRDELSVKDRILDIMEVLKQYETVRFSKLIRQNMDRHEIVVTFLAILELMKMKHIRCHQHQVFDDIVIQWRGETAEHGLSELQVDY